MHRDKQYINLSRTSKLTEEGMGCQLTQVLVLTCIYFLLKKKTFLMFQQIMIKTCFKMFIWSTGGGYIFYIIVVDTSRSVCLYALRSACALYNIRNRYESCSTHYTIYYCFVLMYTHTKYHKYFTIKFFVIIIHVILQLKLLYNIIIQSMVLFISYKYNRSMTHNCDD